MAFTSMAMLSLAMIRRFSPVLYKADRANEGLKKVASDAEAANHSRVSALLANAEFPLTRTVTHVLWRCTA
nr:hypothetical protein [uncultured Lichenicoccus sp.]